MTVVVCVSDWDPLVAVPEMVMVCGPTGVPPMMGAGPLHAVMEGADGERGKSEQEHGPGFAIATPAAWDEQKNKAGEGDGSGFG